jgi:hypothetical protein
MAITADRKSGAAIGTAVMERKTSVRGHKPAIADWSAADMGGADVTRVSFFFGFGSATGIVCPGP